MSPARKTMMLFGLAVALLSSATPVWFLPKDPPSFHCFETCQRMPGVVYPLGRVLHCCPYGVVPAEEAP